MIAPGLIRQALQSGTKAAVQNATIAGMASSVVGLLEDQVKQYERDIVKPGIRMLPWENTSEYPIFQLGTEILGEQVGLLKYIQDKTLKRYQWKLGLITDVFCGSDNKVRHVKVKYINPSSGSPIEVERPVQRLVIILAVRSIHAQKTIQCYSFYVLQIILWGGVFRSEPY